MNEPAKTSCRHSAVALLLGACLGLNAAVPLSTPAADAQPPRVFLLDAKFLQATRQRVCAGDKSLAPALTQLERDAQEALDAKPFSVVNKKSTPPSGDKHDYMSQAPYFWPNPNTSNGLPYIRRDGERNPEIGRISDHRSLDQMAGTVETLALAYYFKSDEASAEKAAGLLRAWFFDPATRMNPNLQYAQSVLGVNDGRGIGLIETRSLTRVVDAVGLLAGAKAWTAADQRQLQDWYARFLQWMQESKNGREEAAAKNNHGTYYDVQAVSFALFLGKTNLAAEIVRTAREKRIAVQIEPDGHQPLELVRTKAWGYSIGNLSGLMLLATLGENVGVDLWHFQTPDGRSISKALDYLAPFAFGQEKWPYQQLGGWPPQMLHPLLRQASFKFPERKYRDWAKKLPPSDPSNRGNLLRPKLPEELEVHE
jgi:hypothetical protein